MAATVQTSRGPNPALLAKLTHGSSKASVSAYRNLAVASLYEHAIRRGQAELAATGPLAIETMPHTGRSPNDKFIVREAESEQQIAWGEINHPFAPEAFDAFAERVTDYLRQRDRFILDLAACADPAYRLPVRIISESAAHALFAHNLFIVPDRDERMRNRAREGGFTILHAPSFHANPQRDGTRSELAILLDFARQMVIITGTRYAGEIKKSIFSALQYLLPIQGVATMHCSCNEGPNGDSALFFGLSGTGKTTLSTDPDRTLIGDDEHGWSDHGVFNFEGGSYAKVINLSPEAEPDIYAASHRFGTVLENVPLDPETREPLLHDDSVTENMRAAFPLSFIKNATTRGTTGHPSNILMLTADAFGVLPPVAKLTIDQGLYYYLSGYTSKLAGTETGIDEPEATFSAGFGLPFMPLDPVRYAELLGERIRRHQPKLWLVHTGWIGGPYGTGRRIKLAYTRAIVRAIINGELDKVPTHREPFFGLSIPNACPDVPAEVLDPKATWQDKDAYDHFARRLAERFNRNFEQFADHTSKAVANAGPRPA
jgi:phosphoenolpyruvate carboxykinase (ATP)